MSIQWEAITAITAVMALVGMLLAIYVRKVVREEISALLLTLNGIYVRTPLCQSHHADMERRIERLEDRGSE